MANQVQGESGLKAMSSSSVWSTELEPDVLRTKIDQEYPEKVAFIPETFPFDHIWNGQISSIIKILLEALDNAPDPLPGLMIGDLIGGAFHCNCVDKECVAWLSVALNGVQLDGFKIKVVDIKDLPKPIKMGWVWKSKVVFRDSNFPRQYYS